MNTAFVEYCVRGNLCFVNTVFVEFCVCVIVLKHTESDSNLHIVRHISERPYNLHHVFPAVDRPKRCYKDQVLYKLNCYFSVPIKHYIGQTLGRLQLFIDCFKIHAQGLFYSGASV